MWIRLKRKHPILERGRVVLLTPTNTTTTITTPVFVTLRLAPLASEMGWTGELWSESNLLILQNYEERIIFRLCESRRIFLWFFFYLIFCIIFEYFPHFFFLVKEHIAKIAKLRFVLELSTSGFGCWRWRQVKWHVTQYERKIKSVWNFLYGCSFPHPSRDSLYIFFF